MLILQELEKAPEIINKIAPEHLALVIRDPKSMLDHIRHAASIFIGELTPEPIGDYICGTNHVLPTNRTARFASPLGTYTFQKLSNIIQYTSEAFHAYAPHAEKFAQIEGLDAHKFSLNIRKHNQ